MEIIGMARAGKINGDAGICPKAKLQDLANGSYFEIPLHLTAYCFLHFEQLLTF